MYKRHKGYFQEAKAIGIDAWCDQNRLKAQVDVQRDISLFIARYSANLEVVITCDGCSEKIRGRRYRCLHCIDMDLCINCYNSGRKPSEHLESHEVIDLRFVRSTSNFLAERTQLKLVMESVLVLQFKKLESLLQFVICFFFLISLLFQSLGSLYYFSLSSISEAREQVNSRLKTRNESFLTIEQFV